MHWHLVTGEYPPQIGGVSDYTLNVARGLAAAGQSVHVWCPASRAPAPDVPGVAVHAIAGTWNGDDIERVDRQLNATPAPRRLLVQWVPHSYGQRSMNLGFCRWVRKRGRSGDIVELMCHEPFLPYREGTWKHDVAATVHRVMVSLLLSATRRVWVSIPAWIERLRPYTFGRHVEFCWLPVPNSIPVVNDPEGVRVVRARYLAGARTLVGHFGTYGAGLKRTLDPIVASVSAASPSIAVLLVGSNSDTFREEFIAHHPEFAGRVHATGALPPDALSAAFRACDLMAQPYPDGASSRRGTLMAALAHGVPVVTSEGRLSEPVWRETRAVGLVPSGDSEAMARAILALCDDAGERSRLAAAGRALYQERFDLSHTIDALVAEKCQAA
jgi:glycosyltransferase involved in cell wall biosynthesis